MTNIKTVKVCIHIDESVFIEMKDLHKRLIAESPSDKRTLEEWIADLAVWGQKPDREWLKRYGKQR